jgi:hypothetical protein
MTTGKQTAKSQNDAAVKAEQERIAKELADVEAKIAARLAELAATTPEPAPPAQPAQPVQPAAATVQPVEEKEPAPVAPVAPVEPPEQRYEYQPVDESGRPMGGKQVIIYKTAEELRDKLVKNHELAIRQMRKVSREKVLGLDEPVIKDEDRFKPVAELKTRDLTAEERFALSQKLQDPEKAAEARDLLIESAFGMKPQELANRLNDTERFIVQQRAVESYVGFVESCPEYYDSAANREAMTVWMGKRKIAPTIDNFKRCFDHLAAQAGLLEAKPVVQQASVAQVVPVVEPPVAAVESEPQPQAPAVAAPGLGNGVQPQAKRHSHVPSGLNASVASPAGPQRSAGISVTLGDIDKLPSDVYRKKLKDPAFAALVDRLEHEAAQKRAELGIRR